jgi:hypothetical protein
MRARVVELLEACTFDYEVVPGKDSITWLMWEVATGRLVRVFAGMQPSQSLSSFLSVGEGAS